MTALGDGKMLKTGTRIELRGTPAMGCFPGVAPETATIGRWTRISGPRMSEYHIVRFADGGQLCVHESRFRIVDNR